MELVTQKRGGKVGGHGKDITKLPNYKEGGEKDFKPKTRARAVQGAGGKMIKKKRRQL